MTNKLKNFPKIYYISLEESLDRQEKLHKQFLDNNITSVHRLLSKRFSECDDKIIGEHLNVLDSGTKGTIISHLKAIKSWYDKFGDDYALFCEDDLSFELVKYWNFTWEDFIYNLPKDAECVQLATVRTFYDGIKLRERSWDDWSATAYIISRDYAKKIIDRHIKGDVYDVTVPDGNIPMPENILFYGYGKVYTVELFTENIETPSTFEKFRESGQKENHYESYEYVCNWWKEVGCKLSLGDILETKVERIPTELEELLITYAEDPENGESNFNLGLWYKNNGHTAPALSYFLRCAERAEDQILAYESLIQGSHCYELQGTRDVSARSLLQHALCLLPQRPEAYFLLAKFHEKREQWQDTYIYSSQALLNCDFNQVPLKTDIGYPGRYGLIFEKAISAWWWGKKEESGNLYKELLYKHQMTDDYRNIVLDNLKKYFQELLIPEDFDWGPTDPEYAKMFSEENFINRTYEKHYQVKNGDIVFDAGANCGSFTYSILDKNPKHIYCVEPSNTIINCLRKNVGHGPVTFINKAISDGEEESKEISDSGVYIYQNDGNTYSTTTFKKIIDDYRISKIDFLKFDCEGGEYSIFTKENYDYIRNNIKSFAGEWHINDHHNAVERFIAFRDLYLKDCSTLNVYERSGKEVTSEIFNNEYLYSFREYWKDTFLGQFMIYFSYDQPENEDILEELLIDESDKMDIVLQGQYDDYTDEIIKSYLDIPFINNIIVSCWNVDKKDEYSHNRVKFIRSEYPSTAGTCNKNLQIVTSLNGIKECKTKFSAKMRSDQKYSYDSMMLMYDFLKSNHIESKIFVGGIFYNYLFHPRDHIFWGKTEDLLELFNIPLEYNSLVDKVKIGKYELAEYADCLTRPETYIGAHYCTKFDQKVKRMIIYPEKYLFDNCEKWDESFEVSNNTISKAFKSFPREGITLDWPKRNGFSYEHQYHCGERWHEDGY